MSSRSQASFSSHSDLFSQSSRLWNVFVNVQLQIPGDLQSVQQQRQQTHFSSPSCGGLGSLSVVNPAVTSFI